MGIARDASAYRSNHGVPNTVCNAALRRKSIGPSSSTTAPRTSKFPGIALTWQALQGVTVELFLSATTGLPGHCHPEMLAVAAKLMDDLHAEVDASDNRVVN